MPDSEPEQQPVNTSDFVRTHCVTCAAGQTITRHGGQKATYCLLLREWMTDKHHGQSLIEDCDRHELKDAVK